MDVRRDHTLGSPLYFFENNQVGAGFLFENNQSQYGNGSPLSFLENNHAQNCGHRDRKLHDMNFVESMLPEEPQNAPEANHTGLSSCLLQ